MKKEHIALGSLRFWNRVNFLEKSNKFSPDEIRNYQNKCLRRLIKLAYKKSSYYRELMDAEGITPLDINVIEDLKMFPISTKNDLKKAGKNILTTNDMNKLTPRFTGGSSGNPLCVYANNSFYGKDKANTYFYVKSFDHDIFNSKSVRIYGESIKDDKGNEILFSLGSNKNRLELNVYLISPKNIEEILNEFKTHKPVYMHGRMSAITHLAKLIANCNSHLKDFKLKTIFVDGETVLPIDRKIIEKTFGAKLINIYGHTEGSLFAFQSSSKNVLDVQGITGIVETPDKIQKNKFLDPRKEVIVTGLNNFAMPFIRYKTDDEVSLNLNSINDSHNYISFKELVGRKIDYLYTKENNQIPLSSLLYNYDDIYWGNIKYWKAKQLELGKVEVTIEIFSNFNELEMKEIRLRIERELNNLAGSSLDIIVTLGIIKPSKRGKIRNFIPYTNH